MKGVYQIDETIFSRQRNLFKLFFLKISGAESDSTVTDSPSRSVPSSDAEITDSQQSINSQSKFINEEPKAKPKPPPKPKIFVTADGKIKPVPPPRPTKA